MQKPRLAVTVGFITTCCAPKNFTQLSASQLLIPPVTRILWYDQRCAAQRRRWDPPGYRSKLGSVEWAAFDGFSLCVMNSMISRTRTQNDEHLGLHGVLYFTLGSGLSIASGWNLCCAASSCIASHRFFLFVVTLFWSSAVFQSFSVMTWWANVMKWLVGPNHRSIRSEVATQLVLFSI